LIIPFVKRVLLPAAFHFSTGWPQVLFDQPTLLFHPDLLIVQPGEGTAPEAARLASETTRRFTLASVIP
jgi:hypothetical protein